MEGSFAALGFRGEKYELQIVPDSIERVFNC